MRTGLRLLGGIALIVLGFLLFAISFGPCGGGYVTIALAVLCWFFGGRKLLRTLLRMFSGRSKVAPPSTQQP